VQKEDSVALYGFLREAERRLFRDVQKVTGIGAKLALAILSGASVEDFARLVQSADVAALTRIPGIGKKTAERLVVELRDRAAAFAVPGVPGTAAAVPHDPLAEASVALQQLGYKPAEVQRMLKAAEPGDRAEEIIRKALKSVLRTG
jgi:Holliday junction DNA helicase RuvA